jgi:hypothetical protein
MTIHTANMYDIGPAPAPPNGCLPDAVPTWDQLTEKWGGGIVARWSATSHPTITPTCRSKHRTASWTATSSMTRAAPSSTRDGSMGDETYPSEPGHGTLSHSSSATSAMQW